jgi:hypothetical protein
MKRTILLLKRTAILYCLATVVSCDYLDIVPDNLASVENAYKNRQEAEKSLYGVYAGVPYFPLPSDYPALLGGDEVWYIEKGPINPGCWNIARGYQNVNSPLIDEYSSTSSGASTTTRRAVWTFVREADTFLDMVDLATDASEALRSRWKSEVKFLKAYYHFYLFRMYGPIPTIEKSLPINTAAGSHLYREPVDEVVDFICSLLDEALPGLPDYIQDVNRELGRATKGWAYAVKAKTLVLAASPLFNGNPDYAGFKDARGIALFPQEYRAEKWQRAADALRQAIVYLEENTDCHLFDFRKDTNYGSRLSDSTVLAMQVRGAVTEKWNDEIVWGSAEATHISTLHLQMACHPLFYEAHNTGGLWKCYAPPLHIVEQFYTKNGIPIEEDASWEGIDLYGLRKGDAAHRYYIEEGFETLNLHFDREARFYGAITFDGGTYYGNGRILRDDNMWVVYMKNGDPGGGISPDTRYLSTGYQCKKLVSYLSSVPDNSSGLIENWYPWPAIRLADLYLLYAEALNEVKGAPDQEVYEYIDRVRARTGLEGVRDSWQKYAKAEFKSKPTTKEGMREIIHRERMNELAFEGQRFWDLRRWKKAKTYMNGSIRGLNIAGRTTEDFYKVRTVFNLRFSDRDYLWPFRRQTLLMNDNLVQNPGW